MKIDFDKVEEQRLEAFKGGDLHYDARICDDGTNKIMLGTLVPGASIGMHTHEGNSEVIFIIAGRGHVLSPDGEEWVEPGQCTYCPPGHAHSLRNDGDTDLRFYAVVH